jgi:hypothetical protein
MISVGQWDINWDKPRGACLVCSIWFAPGRICWPLLYHDSSSFRRENMPTTKCAFEQSPRDRRIHKLQFMLGNHHKDRCRHRFQKTGLLLFLLGIHKDRSRGSNHHRLHKNQITMVGILQPGIHTDTNKLPLFIASTVMSILIAVA